MTSMFWGLKMEPGKRYSTTVDKSFHISMATLDAGSVVGDDEIISVVLEEGSGGVFYLTNLRKTDSLFSHLDLNFMTGDKITLFCKGRGTVHLSGYMVPDEDELSTTMLDDEAEEEEDEEIDEEEVDDSILKSMKAKAGKSETGMKRKIENQTNKKTKKKKTEKILAKSEDSDEYDSNDDGDDDDDNMERIINADLNEADSDLDDEDDDDDDDDEEEEEEEEEEIEEVVLTKKQKKQKLAEEKKQQKLAEEKKQQNQQGKKNQKLNTSDTSQKTPNGVASPQQGKKEDGKKNLEAAKGQQQQLGKESVLSGGVKVKDLKIGHGQVCKPGKQAVVYYSGRLKVNGKVFDSVMHGSGFKFKVGQGEVIKAWDIGVSGMKVGGKRIITCPPQTAYGQKGAPPQIPPNSTLVFEVELRGVN